MSDKEMDKELEQLHFYASNMETWATTTPQRDLSDLLKFMDSQKLTYTLYLVPKPWDTPYKIKWFAPQVEGAKEVAFFEFEKAKKVRKPANVSKGE